MSAPQSYSSSRTNELLASIKDHATELLMKAGIDPEVAEMCGADLANHLADTFGGEQLYIPKAISYLSARRHEKIFKAWQAGVPPAELGRQFGLTQARIYEIIRNVRRYNLNSRQRVLPGFDSD